MHNILLRRRRVSIITLDHLPDVAHNFLPHGPRWQPVLVNFEVQVKPSSLGRPPDVAHDILRHGDSALEVHGTTHSRAYILLARAPKAAYGERR